MEEPLDEKDVGEKTQPSDEAIEVHWAGLEEEDEGVFPGTEGDGGEGQRVAAHHPCAVDGPLAAHCRAPADRGGDDPANGEESEGEPRGETAIRIKGHDEAGGAGDEADIEDVEFAHPSVETWQTTQYRWEELGETSGEGQHAGEDMNPKSKLPVGDPEVLLLDLEKASVVAKREIVECDAQHQP